MSLDLAPTIEFCGRPLKAGEHRFCVHSLIPEERRGKAWLAEAKGVDVAWEITKILAKEGWDVKRLPYDREENPWMDKILVTIYIKDNQISKTP